MTAEFPVFDAHGSGLRLPCEVYTLPELRVLLLERGTDEKVRDAVWVVLAGLAQREREVWALPCAWLALPGLAARARGLRRALAKVSGVTAQDVDSELLLGFWEALLQTRAEVNVCSRLLAAAVRHVWRELDVDPIGLRLTPWPEGLEPAAAETGHPELVLLRAVRMGLISARDAALIARTRLEGSPLRLEGAQLSVKSLASRRRRAESALVTALRAGLL
ncbi:hypothetical protein [Kineosporia babensis]|uniref:Uncharacterized protein n=1 Tax=Kineosporia babensis TaxID=499548 RepID=A0A9X1NMS5_9ACTN|nr:hypothetical protein [Kineosporia babensis]MCD5316970.1 hypothetical protein [Kineosporia babensis]